MGSLFWQYVFYGFCGFLLEVALAKTIHSPKQDRKCHLLLPVCPVYGVGALVILLLPPAVKSSPALLFLSGAAVATAVEWGFSVFYQRAVGASFWDYSGLPLNIDGRVCLLFSLSWGTLALPLVYGLSPLVSRWAAAVPGVVTLPCALFYLWDAVTSLALLRRGGTDALRWYVPR